MIKLGTNILSQKVQHNLGRATADLPTTSERLASGQRINTKVFSLKRAASHIVISGNGTLQSVSAKASALLES